MNRHEYRLNIMFALYQSLLISKDIELAFNDIFNDDNDEFLINIKKDLINNYKTYIKEIEPLLKNWSFDRLPYVDQAILLEAYSELKLKLNNKNIVIDEAIRLSKEYSDKESFKYINGVLDNL